MDQLKLKLETPSIKDFSLIQAPQIDTKNITIKSCWCNISLSRLSN